MFNRLYLSSCKVGVNATYNYGSNLGSVHQVPVMAGCTQRSVEYKVCLTLLHMTSAWNQTPDLLILNPTPYLVSHVLPTTCNKSHLTHDMIPMDQMDHERWIIGIIYSFVSKSNRWPKHNTIFIMQKLFAHRVIVTQGDWMVCLKGFGANLWYSVFLTLGIVSYVLPKPFSNRK